MDRRMGRFRVTREMIDDSLGEIIYRGLVPLEVRYCFDHDGFEVTAIGNQFAPVERGKEAPRYLIEFDFDYVATDGAGTRGVNGRASFVKVEG